MLQAQQRPRATKNCSRPTAFVRFFSATFWPAATYGLLYGQAETSYTAGTYAPFCLKKFIEKL